MTNKELLEEIKKIIRFEEVDGIKPIDYDYMVAMVDARINILSHVESSAYKRGQKDMAEQMFCNCRGRSIEQTEKGYRGICHTCRKFIDDDQRKKLEKMGKEENEC